VTAEAAVDDDPLAGQPFLGESQLRTLQQYGSEQAMSVGDVLFADGDSTYDLIVVLTDLSTLSNATGLPTPMSSSPMGDLSS
jgi:hypothetical protein